MRNTFLFVTWGDYHLLVQKLAATILTHSPPQDEIVAISRGGLTFGHLLSDFLQLSVFSFAIQSYKDIQKQGELTITQELGRSIAGKRILLVDDVSDTGKTFMRAVAYVKGLNPKSITTVSPFFKPRSAFQPDYFAKRTSKWIIFPSEVTETITSITHMMEKEGKTKIQIQDFLTNLGFREGQVAFVRKHHMVNS